MSRLVLPRVLLADDHHIVAEGLKSLLSPEFDFVAVGEDGRALMPRQREILRLLAEGRSAKEIADVPAISARTVEFHRCQVMETPGLHHSTELVHFAIKHGIVTIWGG